MQFEGGGGLPSRWEAESHKGLVVCVVTSIPALRAGLTSLLESLEAVDRVCSAGSLVDFESCRYTTDILLLSPDAGSGLELEEILDDPGLSGVLILADEHNEHSWFVPQFRDIPWGILPLGASIEQFEAALQAINAGLSTGMPSMLTLLPGEEDADLGEPLIDPLTERELEVLQLLAQGKANKQIALDLAISEHTVKFHVSSIYTKLGASNRTEAARLGVRTGLITL
ncbi:MAG: LuxR C-terminal-related transcriptional regulator [Anaerolineales bacterium]